jgi:hypothetical protein
MDRRRLTYDALGFRATYKCESLDRLPSEAWPVHRYPEGSDGEDLILAVEPIGRERWIAVFERELDYPDGLFGYPDPVRFCVNVGGLGYAVSSAEPRDHFLIEAQPVTTVSGLASLNMIIFADFWRLYAYGSNRNPLWITDELSDDGLRISQADSEVIRGQGWSAAWQRWCDFELDPHDGRVLTSARPLSG